MSFFAPSPIWLTGKKRVRPVVVDGRVLLVLQGQEARALSFPGPSRSWRDATVEDIPLTWDIR